MINHTIHRGNFLRCPFGPDCCLPELEAFCSTSVQVEINLGARASLCK